MCLVACALNAHPDYPLIVLANRDEFYARPAAPLHRWPDLPLIGGRDLEQGGSWLLVDEASNWAAVTNVREGVRAPAGNFRSRGELPVRVLTSTGTASERIARLSRDDHLYPGYNLLLGWQGALWYHSNRTGSRGPLHAGIHLLSNAGLNTPWPKTRRLQARLEALLACGSLDPDALLELLADPTPAPDNELPDTGVPLSWERRLSSIFIQAAEENYGTRASTLLLRRRDGQILLCERRHDIDGPAGEERLTLSLSHPAEQSDCR